MRFTVVGDPHVTTKSLDRFQRLIDIVEAQHNKVIWMGDLLDNKEVIRGKCLNAWFEYLRDSKLEHIILVGNHDWFNLECLDHSLKTLSSLPNVTVVDSLQKINHLYFLPYVHNGEKLRKILSQVPDGATVFGHMDVKNFDYGNGHYSESGLELSELSRFKLVVSGHYHAFQQKDNLIYIGTPFSHSFGESDQAKFIGLFESNESTLEVFPTPMARHVTLELDLEKLPETKDLVEWFDTHFDNYVRVLLWGSQAKIAAFPKHQFDRFNIRWIPKPDDIGNNDISLEEGIDNKHQFLKWATQIKKLDQQTLELGLSIIEAMNAK